MFQNANIVPTVGFNVEKFKSKFLVKLACFVKHMYILECPAPLIISTAQHIYTFSGTIHTKDEQR